MDSVPREMASIFGAQVVALGVIATTLTRRKDTQSSGKSSDIGSKEGEAHEEMIDKKKPDEVSAKIKCENFFILYGICVWIPVFALIVGLKIYESMGKYAYIGVCGGLAAPLLLQPLMFPKLTGEENVPLKQRHCLKANVWIAIYSFLGNYWATHYFYCVLKAKYTMDWLPAFELNSVPVCMYFATHFYFTFYHAVSNKLFRFVTQNYIDDAWRLVFMVVLVINFAYFTAFLETFSISNFPHYTFENRQTVYTIGSLFYALYLVVSFPMYFRLDNHAAGKQHTLFEACLESLASFMMILILLDAVRLGLGIPFVMP